MKFLSWNCRGVRNDEFRRACNDIILINKLDVVCFLETKSSSNLASLNFMRSLGFDMNFQVPPVGFAGGLWLFWKSGKILLDVLSSTDHYIHCSVMQGSRKSLLSFAYVQPHDRLKNQVWRDLALFSNQCTVRGW